MSSSTSNSDAESAVDLQGSLEFEQQSNFGRVRCFVWRFLVFCTPLVALWLPFEWYLWKTGENLPATVVLALQSKADEEVLYGRGLLNQQFNVYKVAAWRKFNPRIVAVGSSRVWRLRKEAFHPREADFYNAGGILQCADDFRELVDMVEDGRLPKPESLIVGIDPWWFKTNHQNRTWLDNASLKDDAFKISARRNSLKRLWENPSLLSHSRSNSQHIGVYGSIGFRLDGTMKVSDSVIETYRQNPVYIDRESPPIVWRIKNRSGRFSDSRFNERTLGTMMESMQRLRASGVLVIAFFPPFADEAWDAMNRSDEIMRWMRGYLDHVIPEITNATGLVITFGHSRSLGVDDTYFLDGMHAGEKLSTMQWLDLVEQHKDKPFFRQFAPQFVRQQISQRCSTPLAYD